MDKARVQVPNEDVFLLATPMHRQMNAGTAWCIEKAHQSGLSFLWKPHPGDALIGRARSIQATWFLEHVPYPYMIFLDSDIIFEPESLKKLHDDLKAGYDLVGGVYTVRYAQQLAHTNKNGIILDGSIKEIDYLSTGFMGISKKLLQSIVDKLKLPLCHANFPHFRCYPFFESTAVQYNGEWIYESEDWDFCRKAKQAGFNAYLDTSILLGHEGNKVWTVGDMPKGAIKELPGKIVLPSKKAGHVRNSPLVLLKGER
jgi:hypothetical protein